MNNISVIGLDLAKNVFQVYGVDAHGEVVMRKQFKRRDVRKFFARLEPCLVGMEACGGMHYWSRELARLGHCVRAMGPRFIKPYLKSNKNDRNDAAAICEAVQRPHMRFVPAKTVEQQAILHLHHSRRLLLQMRVGLSNHLRGVLLEYGVTVPRGPQALARRLPEILEDADNGPPLPVRHLVADLRDQHRHLAAQIARLEAQLKAWHARCAASQRLASIPGIGLLTATALAATVGDGKAFANGRQLAAYLGLVPRQASSGGRTHLLGISKRGDSYLRALLIHGARAVIYHVRRRLRAGQAPGHAWLAQLLGRCHANEAAVALANKTARIAWAVLTRQETYRQAPLVGAS